MHIRTSIMLFLVLIFAGSCGQKTEMAPAPGSNDSEIVVQMLKYMKEQDSRNREERKQIRKEILTFIEKQNSENRKMVRDIISHMGKTVVIDSTHSGIKEQPVDTSENSSETSEENTSETTEENASENQKTTNATKISSSVDITSFVEEDDRPEPVEGQWSPNAKHIDPKQFTKVDLEQYPVFPNEDRDADPEISAAMGGKGFGKWATEHGWQTNTTFPLVGDPNAKKGGRIVRRVQAFPDNIRPMGKAYNTQLNYFIRFCLWQTMLREHPVTKEVVPYLATHWKKESDSDGKTNYFFRLNPNAKFNDGTPVTTDDVVATFKFYTDPDMGHPSNVEIFNYFDPPVQISKYIFSIKERVKKWSNWDTIAYESFWVHSAKQLDAIKERKDYNVVFNLSPAMGSGAYEIRENDVVDEQSVKIVRKKDWWAKDSRLCTGLFNLDEIKWTVVSEDSVALEKFKKGEIDAYYVYSSRLWVEQMNFEEVQKGYIQKRMIYNHRPQSTQFIAMNQERVPFDSWEVRRAFSHLFPFKKINSQLMYNVYLRLNSYYPAGPYENINNPEISYDREKALRLLARVGYKTRDPQTGLLVNEKGEPLKVTLMMRDQGLRPHYEIFQNACKEVGITLVLEIQTGSSAFNSVQQRDYQMYSGAWGATQYPGPETSWKSTLAKGSNNITGLKNARIDELIEAYDREFDIEKRYKIIQELDGELHKENPYILTWYAPFQRLLWWDKFSYPPGVIFRYRDEYYFNALWWYNEEKQQRLDSAMKEGRTLTAGGVKNEFWNKFRDWASAQAKSE